jgi:hypothetical protein
MIVFDEMWLPFYQKLLGQIEEALLRNPKVVVTMAPFGLFQEQKVIENRFSNTANVYFVKLEVSKSTLYDRMHERVTLRPDFDNLHSYWAPNCKP